jgi:transposase
VAHADVNAAFNIAAASLRTASGEYLAQQYQEPTRLGKKELRRQIRALVALQNTVPPVPVAAEGPGSDNLLAVLE